MSDDKTIRADGKVDGLMTIGVRSGEQGPLLTREPIREADYSEAFSEFYRDHVLRKGQPQIPLSQISARLIPLRKKAGAIHCAGYRLQFQLEGQPVAEAEFGVHSLEWVAQRAIERLRQQKILRDHQEVTYELLTESAVGPAEPTAVLHCPVETRPVVYLNAPLPPLLLRAETHQAVPEGAFHVFYTAAALEKAERFSRKGALDPRRVETGAVLAGFLCSCPETGDFFPIVSDVFEVQDAVQTPFSLAYTSRSWARVHAVVQARQAVQPAIRLLGQCHGHNFLPNGGKTCEPCRQRPTCSLNNVFVSTEDQNWSRAVFCRQPWQLCHIFGLSARGDRLNAVHTLQNGRLSARGYFVLPSFDPEQYETRGGPHALGGNHAQA